MINLLSIPEGTKVRVVHEIPWLASDVSRGDILVRTEQPMIDTLSHFTFRLQNKNVDFVLDRADLLHCRFICPATIDDAHK